MEKLYEQDAYLQAFDAQVLSCVQGKGGWDVILDRTAFYPEGGGQPYDTGTLGGVKVLQVHTRGEDIVHTCDGPLEPGSRVSGQIDWDRRFDLMQNHSGEHIVSGIANAWWGCDNVGFHMGSDFITIDLNTMIDEEQLHRLHQAGVTSYHHNIETSRRNFPNICTTHTYDMKVETLKKVKAEGMCACSGGIIGMGETWEDRLDMAVSLAELGIDSIPINALMPIPGTPLENMPQLTEDEILRTIAFFRYINPEANIRLAAGRALLTNDGETAFKAGASATITGNMLTTAACATIRSDRSMLADMGRDVTPEYWKEA